MFQINSFSFFSLTIIFVGLTNSISLAQKMYWCEGSSSRISRSNLDGTSIEVLISTGLITPDGMALDLGSGKIYWAEQGGSIKRANLDGTSIELIVNAGGVPDSVALNFAATRVCWTESGAGRIRCSDFSGSNVVTVVDSDATSAHGLAIDAVAGKIYWAQLNGSIRRANLDGTENELIVGSALGPHGLALDITNSKLYWVDLTANRIQRSNLDGSNLETLVTVGNGPAAIALDVDRGKMYWTDLSDGRIRVANLDGTDVEILVSGLSLPLGISLDLSTKEIPTISTWGLIVMMLLLITVGTMVIGRQRVTS